MATNDDISTVIKRIVDELEAGHYKSSLIASNAIALLTYASLLTIGLTVEKVSAASAEAPKLVFRTPDVPGSCSITVKSGSVQTVFSVEVPEFSQTLTYSIVTKDFVDVDSLRKLQDEAQPSNEDVKAAFVSDSRIGQFLQFFKLNVIKQLETDIARLESREELAADKGVNAEERAGGKVV